MSYVGRQIIIFLMQKHNRLLWRNIQDWSKLKAVMLSSKTLMCLNYQRVGPDMLQRRQMEFSDLAKRLETKHEPKIMSKTGKIHTHIHRQTKTLETTRQNLIPLKSWIHDLKTNIWLPKKCIGLGNTIL